MIYKICNNCKAKIPINNTCNCSKAAAKKRYKNYDTNIRDKNKTNFYNNKNWVNLRNYIMTKYSNLCIVCLLEDNTITKANAVHHIITLEDDNTKALQEDNLICLCHAHHNTIHALYDKQDKQIKNKLRDYNNTFLKLFN